MAVDLLDDIANLTLAGIAEAQAAYKHWTGGRGLWQAPDHMVTTYIAKHLSDIEDTSFYLTLDHPVRDAIGQAGALPDGRPRNALRPNGKFDLLVWTVNGRPGVLVEVKKQVKRFSGIKADVSRICTLLRIPDTSFRCGFIAYYTSCGDRNGELPKDVVRERVEAVANDVKQVTNENGLTFKRYPGHIEGDDSDAWTAEVLKISR